MELVIWVTELLGNLQGTMKQPRQLEVMVTPCPQGLKGQGEEEAELPEPRGQGHLPKARIVADLSGRNQRPKESHCQKCH